jgi:Ca2+/Na+ antiporter
MVINYEDPPEEEQVDGIISQVLEDVRLDAITPDSDKVYFLVVVFLIFSQKKRRKRKRRKAQKRKHRKRNTEAVLVIATILVALVIATAPAIVAARKIRALK